MINKRRIQNHILGLAVTGVAFLIVFAAQAIEYETGPGITFHQSSCIGFPFTMVETAPKIVYLYGVLGNLAVIIFIGVILGFLFNMLRSTSSE